MATFNGVDIFGPQVQMTPVPLPNARQVNHYFGVAGLEVIDGGATGGHTEVAGILFGASEADLVAAEQAFRNFEADGGAYTLVDNLGTTWLDVILEQYQPQGRVRQSPGGIFWRPYVARFFHV